MSPSQPVCNPSVIGVKNVGGQRSLSDSRALSAPRIMVKSRIPKQARAKHTCCRDRTYILVQPLHNLRVRGRAKGLLPPQLKDYIRLTIFFDCSRPYGIISTY